MDNSIFEVSRDEYAGVVARINPEYANMEKYHESDCTIIKLMSKNGIHFTTRIIPDEEGEEGYYVFNLPSPEESLPTRAVRQITLLTKDAVQDFFNALGKLQGAKKDD